jgi:tRNA(Ile)-lysidine synthase
MPAEKNRENADPGARGRATAMFHTALARLLPLRPPVGPWIVALSGGCDSTALCCLLHNLAGRDGCPAPAPGQIHALHVHHGLRGADADADEEAARETARALAFPFRSVRLSPPAGLARGAIEKWARGERYRALHDAADEIAAPIVLTGHNRNDQAETVLLRIRHGAGYHGLAGIRPRRPLLWGSEVRLLRPLLGFTRDALAAFLREYGRPCRQDPTNDDIFFRRNRVRHRLIPLLARAFDGDLVEDLNGIAETAGRIHRSLDRAAEKIVIREPGRCLIPLSDFVAAPEVIRFGLLRASVHAIAPRQVPLSATAFSNVTEAVIEKPGGRPRRSWDLGGHVCLRREGSRLVVERRQEPETPALADSIDLPLPGRAGLPDGTTLVAVLTDSCTDAGRPTGNPDREILDADRAGTGLTVRFRLPGDTFHPLGAPGRKKLKSFLIDRKIPMEMRGRIPLVCRGDEILWVVGIRMAEKARVTGRTRRFLLLERIPPER